MEERFHGVAWIPLQILQPRKGIFKIIDCVFGARVIENKNEYAGNFIAYKDDEVIVSKDGIEWSCRSTPHALDGGDSAEVLSTLQGESTPTHRN